MIYLDNAATTWPKPPAVIDAAAEAMLFSGGNPGRGSHPLAEAAAELAYTCRETAGRFFGASPDRVVFTSGATASLNIAIRGLVPPGGHILYDNLCHNAVRRPILAMVREGLAEAEQFDGSGDDDAILASLCAKIQSKTALIVATHQANICSKVLPIRKIGTLCKARGIPFVVDAAQSAGHIPIDLDRDGISALAVPGHKGLYGPQGVGLLVLGEGVFPPPLLYGGAGIRSLDAEMPEELPERLEAGTLPLPAIAGLLAGIRWVEGQGIDAIRSRTAALSEAFTSGLGARFTVHGPSDGSVVSFTHNILSPAEIGTALAEEGICVRTGFHCAPDAHRTLGTGPDGSVRVSFSAWNTAADVERILNVLHHLDEYSFPSLDFRRNS